MFGLTNIAKDSGDTRTRNRGAQVRIGIVFPLGRH